MLNRRTLLGKAGATLTTALLGTGHSWAAPSPARAEGLNPTPFGEHPLLQPLRGWSDGQDRLAEGLRVQGRWPRELRGTLYRNGPGLLGRGGLRYRHWFDGDGLVQAWQLGPEALRHTARFVQTRKFSAEQEAGEFLVPAFGTVVPARRPVRGSDDMNTANTSVTVQGGRLYALWEGGSAHELDPQTLRTLGPKTWAPELRGMPFSAHPKREADGTLWNFGTFLGRLALYQIDAQGRLLRSRVLSLPTAAMVHDFVVTQRHLVFLLPPLGLDLEAARAGASMVSAMRWRADEAMRVVVIDKATLELQHTLEAPAGLVFHFGNAWDDGQGTIRLDYVQSDMDEFLSGRFNAVLEGAMAEHGAPSQARFMTLDLRQGRVSIAARSESTEFPQVDPRVVAQRYRYVYAPTQRGLADRWGFNAVQRLDLERGHTEVFDFGPDTVVEEHLLVPKPGSCREGEGWLLGTGFDARRQRSFAAVFDAEALSAGPLATVWLPYWVPLGFHGHFQRSA